MRDPREQIEAGLIGHYTIDRELGRGGMATVYLAEDLKHHRRVALKVLRPELIPALGSDRFLREIAIASRLQHPHILSLHDSGEANGMLYYAMPYVEGESLRARLTREVQLDLTEAVRIAGEVAEALGHAHQSGVLHRDIKPENILLSNGHAVVADFGIARAIDAAGGEHLTETGLALGTPHYMSPEQASGERVLDGRSDLYALACVLYEMLGGEPPFTGPTAQSILARHAIDPVPSLRTVRTTVPQAVEAVITRALAKVPADRFASALEFKKALSQALLQPDATKSTRRPYITAGAIVAIAVALVAAFAGLRGRGIEPHGGRDAAPLIRSLAVSPLLNLTGDSSQVYLAEGITSQLITSLSRISALRVIGLKSDQARMGAAELARSLRIDGMLAGSLQRAGDSVRISVQLSSPNTGQTLWADSYDGEFRAMLGLQDRVARAVADRLRVGVSAEEGVKLNSARREIDPAAYQAYVRGWHFLERNNEAGFRRALGYFAQAIDADPTYAPAYVGLALSYEEMGYYTIEPAKVALPKARAAALKALELDSTSGEAQASLAAIDAIYTWDFAAAERGFQRALVLTPRYARGHLEYGMLLTGTGRIDEGIAQLKQAQELDPLSKLTQAAAARPYWNGRRYDEAIAQAGKSLELDSNFSRAHYWLGMSYLETGRARDAVREFQKTFRQAGPIPVYRAALAFAYARAGDPGRARELLRRLEKDARVRPVSEMEIAAVHLALGDRERCFTSLERAYEDRDAILRFLAVDPRFDDVRNDPRFQNLLRRIGFPAGLISRSVTH